MKEKSKREERKKGRDWEWIKYVIVKYEINNKKDLIAGKQIDPSETRRWACTLETKHAKERKRRDVGKENWMKLLEESNYRYPWRK